MRMETSQGLKEKTGYKNRIREESSRFYTLEKGAKIILWTSSPTLPTGLLEAVGTGTQNCFLFLTVHFIRKSFPNKINVKTCGATSSEMWTNPGCILCATYSVFVNSHQKVISDWGKGNTSC